MNASNSKIISNRLVSHSPRFVLMPVVLAFMMILILSLSCVRVSGQISQVVFADDFSSNTIDPGKYQPDAPFFEGGLGDIHAEAGNGVLRFVGTTSQQWWSGGTLRIVPTFNATEQANLSVSIDRVAEQGIGSASRSALWILDETQTKYVLFADVRGEGGWHYNRKIGEDGDVPTGSGTDIAAFNGGTFDDGGLHRMKVVADGKTVKLYLDNQFGTEVKFPFPKVVVQIGSYARANNDTADTTFDNLSIEVLRQTEVVFSDDFSSNTIDPGKYQPDAPFFEGGLGDIHAEAGNGVIKFVGTTSQQWWSGGTLRVVPTFNATEETIVAASIDRVAEQGVGSASRSALWILDETKTKYVLFADVRGEGGWHYNRKIGEDGDVPTGSGTDIAAFNGGNFDDGGLHRMKLVANGQTVKLYLDDIFGVEVKFPFSRVVFEFGSYARANNDTADTTFDNFKVETTTVLENVVFSDNFDSNTIDPNLYKPDAPFFEGGQGDIHAEAGNGVVRFVGTVAQQWWAGATLRLDRVFTASDESTITLTIDRVAEQGLGSASRSALWILDQTQTKYVLFADVRGEGGWRYNRKIGEDGDVPTGSGTDIAAFNGGTFDDGGLHKMKMVADGKTVKLFLDDQFGTEVRFPFTRVIFHFGSYARANNDTADTTWDNLKIVATGAASFVPTVTSVRTGQLSENLTLRIAEGLNAARPIQVRVVSASPTIAIPEGGVNGALDVTFPAGGANTASFRARGVAPGSAQFTVQGGLPGANQLTVVVDNGASVLTTDDFEGATIDANKWQVSTRPFEVGTGTFFVDQVNGMLKISGSTDSPYWAGASLMSKAAYTATKDFNLVVEVDRVLLDPTRVDQGIGIVRSGVYLTSADHSQYFLFSHDYGENGWTVNVAPGSTATGGGTTIPAFSNSDDAFPHRMKLVFDGEGVDVYLDDVRGTRVPFVMSAGIYVELAAYARDTGDAVDAQFDNLKISHALPCASVAPASGVSITAIGSAQATVTIPRLLNDLAPVAVTVTSRDKTVAVPNGVAGGSVVLNFAAGAPNSQTFIVTPVNLGATAFDISTSPQNCVAGSLPIEVVAPPLVLISDSFSGAAIDDTIWRRDETPFIGGAFRPAPDSDITLVNGEVKIQVTADAASWPGLALLTVNTFSAGPTTPLTFEIDRVLLDFVLVTGTGARQRAGIWIKDANGNYVLFADHQAHDGNNFGWRVNTMTGDPATDHPTDDGINITAFDGGGYDDSGLHRMKLEANGQTVKLYLDGAFGLEVPFPFSDGLTVGFGAYVGAATDVVKANFDNALLTGNAGSYLRASRQGANVVISWSGAGVLESTTALQPSSWQSVVPPPVGNTLTVPIAGSAGKFYRLRQ